MRNDSDDRKQSDLKHGPYAIAVIDIETEKGESECHKKYMQTI